MSQQTKEVAWARKPILGLRLGIIRGWDSKWFATHEYSKLLEEDLLIRRYIRTKLSRAGISKVEIERKANKAIVNICTARPGIVIGRKGTEVERLNDELEHLTKKEIRLNILEVKRVESGGVGTAANGVGDG